MSVGSGRAHLRDAYDVARKALLDSQLPGGYWVGELSPSALSTATAVSAFSLVSRERFAGLIASGRRWLESHQNDDGGWGDTPESPSNLSTTLLVSAALELAGEERCSDVVGRMEDCLCRVAGQTAEERIEAVTACYGADRTFAVPILTNCALAGQVQWRDIPGLPFELGCIPHKWLRLLRAHVVSYALPALIAIGQLLHARRPSGNPVLRILRRLATGPTLRKLEAIQPASGGFIEAVPLTSFVVMSLAANGRADHPVSVKGIEFLEQLARADGSWPIDSNLSVWLTTLAVSALSADGQSPASEATKEWLLATQYRQVHPFTQAEPGGWGWTHLPGGVPDTDDTSGALLALAALGGRVPSEAIAAGVEWLLNLQNADGGWPTFCRGWGRLPFDQSAPDLTAHAIRALHAWRGTHSNATVQAATPRGLRYLSDVQRPDGAWVPLWFGNQHTAELQSPVYGTARVLAAYHDLGDHDCAEATKGVNYLLGIQNCDGGWSGDAGAPSSIEETALAVEALAAWRGDGRADEACGLGGRYLAERIQEGGLAAPEPIGLYFARLWYSERLYPLIWSVAALGRSLGPNAAR